tara:strand:- start:97 stop:555 length:459 start_codon:yes stop_codon:yes gene_type:complete
VLFDGTRIHCANAGDSRAIAVKLKYRETGDDNVNKYSMTAYPLSTDHKPELPDERDRILKMGGRIDSFHDSQNGDEPIGPQRVWLQDQEIPGLAMSRSLGDQIAHSVGVSSVPETQTFNLGTEDKFVVIGSDGVFEFLTNDEIARIVLPFYG